MSSSNHPFHILLKKQHSKENIEHETWCLTVKDIAFMARENDITEEGKRHRQKAAGRVYFQYYYGWIESALELDKVTRNEILSAIALEAYGIKEELSQTAEAVLCFIRPQLKKDMEKYESICEKRSLAGKKGGAKKGNKNASKTSKNKQNKHLLDLLDFDKNNDDLNKENTILASSKGTDNQDDTKENKQKQAKQANAYNKDKNNINYSLSNKKEKKEILSFKEKEENIFLDDKKDDSDAFKEFFNCAVAGCRINPICTMTEKRREAVRALKEEFGLPDVEVAVIKAAESLYLNGEAGSKFTATFDWIMKRDNFVTILEGNYDNGVKPAEIYRTPEENVEPPPRRESAVSFEKFLEGKRERGESLVSLKPRKNG